MKIDDALALIRPIPDFPIPGVLFQDIAPLIANPKAYELVTKEFAQTESPFNLVAGVESRGFILASAIAIDSAVGFVPIRKAGKLPGAVIKREYGLEYGSDSLEMQVDALAHIENPKVLLIDDVLATGGTLIAALELIADLAGEICEIAVLLEISALGGRERILAAFPDLKIRSLVKI
ncbi:MAG: adenine phosphoribosyltransferase [Actinobacteria bacterium]|nr:adenine phosphoribosyltransferase [Actinomycetota bacterium]